MRWKVLHNCKNQWMQWSKCGFRCAVKIRQRNISTDRLSPSHLEIQTSDAREQRKIENKKEEQASLRQKRIMNSHQSQNSNVFFLTLIEKGGWSVVNLRLQVWICPHKRLISSLLSWSSIATLSEYTLFFYKNLFYTNVEAEIYQNFKNMLRT